MEFTTLLENRYLLMLGSALIGIVGTLITQQILNKRALFSYFVTHYRVGVSADDAVFGSVRVTWNENPVGNLYSSTVELVNESLRDFENIVVRAFSNNTVLLTERTEIVNTTLRAEWTESFRNKLYVEPGERATDTQIALHSAQREYFIPVMNRGQVVRFHFLNAANTEHQPTIWLDLLHKGIKLKFQIPQNQILGVSQTLAALNGVILGILLVGALVIYIESMSLVAFIALIYGFGAQLPGALLVKAWRALRDLYGG